MVERDIPEPGGGEVRIRVQACGICHSDTFTIQGLFPGIQYPRVPGHEIAASEEPVEVPTNLMILGRRSLTGWPAGTSIDSQDTLSFSVLSGVRSMNEVFPLEHAAEAYDHMMSGKAKFRCVLTTGN
jgi:D-arabinose 1-dehydrogenase-like Zn-dependent alcohol dehydrogenase